MPKLTGAHPSRLFRAFSDPTRLRLMNLLASGEVCVCDLVDTLRVPQPTASRHLAALRRAGLVSVRKDGLWSYYALAPGQDGLSKRLLACLDACKHEAPELSRDLERMQRVRRRRGCCD